MYLSWHDPVIVNTIGHCAGALLFCAITFLLIRSGRAQGGRRVLLPLGAALLALGWNAGSLLVLAFPNGNARWIEPVVTISFSMLTFLPALLLQVVLQGRHRLLVAFGYAISFASAALHFAELRWSDLNLHQGALLLVAVGFGVLSLVTLLRTALKQTVPPSRITIAWPQSIALACLLLFTTSFLHFGYQHTASPWAAEVTWHHIGIPAALIVLLRDYRFLLLDTFLRFAVNFGLSVVYVVGVLALVIELRLWDVLQRSPFLAGIAVVAACLSLISFAYLRSGFEAWLGRVVFRHGSAEECARQIRELAIAAHSEQELVARCCQLIARHLRTDQFSATTQTPVAEAALASQKPFHPEAKIPLRLSSGDVWYFAFGERQGGQRYWSEDLNDMTRLGSVVVEQIERFRAEELKRLVTQAELRALQAQINPHFLFNAFNTLYGTINRESRDARRMVLNLAEIFRYVLRGNRTFIPLSEELRIVEAYLEIEQLRLGSRFTSELAIPDGARSVLIPILSIQPLVENAIKHGVTLKAEPCRVTVRVDIETEGVRIVIEDSGIGFARSREQVKDGTGLGLENVRRRLLLAYGSSTTLDIQSNEEGSRVSFLVPRTQPVLQGQPEQAVSLGPFAG